MFIQQFFVSGLAHSSYLLGGTSTCAIVDPRRDIELYLDAAASMGMKITHILQTHLHADFVSGHLDLAEATGAVIVAPRSADCQFSHLDVAEGDSFQIDDLEIRVLETPGHTPEHITYVVVDHGRGPEPAVIFCGDTLFVGDVGRPDLFPGMALELAAKLYGSLHEKLMALPPFCEVYPAHGAGSLCGRAMGAKRTSTVGYEKLYNGALAIGDRQRFITSLTTDMPAAPDHFSRCSDINRRGPALVRTLPVPAPLPPQRFREAMAESDTVVLDVRGYAAFGGQHVPGSYHIDLGGNFATFAGWVLPPDRKILLVAEQAHEASEAAVALHRVGLDQVIGYLEGGMFEWAKAGFGTDHVPQLSAPELNQRISCGDGLVLVDVRSVGEFGAAHVEGAIHIPAPQLRTRHTELDPDRDIALVCSTGHRSSLAASILKRNGFSRVWNVAGGMTGFNAAGFAPECPLCVVPHGPRFMGR
ncbi:MBL fold metallo-hydrolase [Geobacter sulfurreducens]|uniref:MBL fold metallo-hydrolase n=1 Tax=Geobacter sulfurreducens TaxID=35554 RepID=UPI0001E34210|nr:MBL fold metallo-hydrolase [Geobacter sulfurreducens]ADI85067.2 metal-dependent hydrolase, beta-lactamase superfamily [Geobacter sulfurreducens KN400]UTG91666.1 MBL fold metallo-hydrolase [Geobacter sulfurreducens]